MKMSLRNTKKSGSVTVFTYKQGKGYLSVCLELDIVKEGSNFSEITQEMIESVIGHVQTVCKEGLSDGLLNRPAPAKYWKAYERFLDAQSGKETKKKVGSLSILPIADLCLA